MAVFGWCISGQHEACMVSNAGTTCTCTCENHGTNYAPPQPSERDVRLRNIATKAMAGGILARENKIDLRKKDNRPTMSYEEALESIGVGTVKHKKPGATTLDELKQSR